jgi:hypothetical protein
MTHAERYAWLSLVAWAGILLFLLMRFTAGFEVLGQSLGFTIVEQSAGDLRGTYVSLVVLAIVAESLIAGSLAIFSSREKVEKDERDHAIESRASLAAYWFVAAALNVIVIQVLAGAAFGGRVLPQLSVTQLTTMTGIAFALLVVLTSAEIVNRIALIWNYRRA